MPATAQPVPFPDDAPPVAVVEDGPSPTWARSWHDPLGRPMHGTVSLTRVGRPAYVVTADLVDGSVALALRSGAYRLVAALFDRDETRSYDMDLVLVR